MASKIVKLTLVYALMWLCTFVVVYSENIVIYGTTGSSVTLRCDVIDSSDVSWYDWVYNHDRNALAIYLAASGLNADHPNANNYKVNEPEMSLTIENLSLDDSGRYFCQSGETQITYMLTVGDKPTCSASRTDTMQVGASVNLTCELQYSGTGPQVQWTRGLDDAVVPSEDHDELSHVKRVVPLRTAPDVDRRTYTCRIALGNTVETCNLTLNVEYAVQNVSLSPAKKSYSVGEVLSCTARGRPDPQLQLSFKLPTSADFVPTEHSTHQVAADWTGQEITVQCTGSNTVNGMSYTASSQHDFTVVAKVVETATSTPVAGGVGKDTVTQAAAATAGTSTGVIIAIVVGVVVVVLVVVACICLRRRKQNRKGAKRLPTSETEMNSKQTSRA